MSRGILILAGIVVLLLLVGGIQGCQHNRLQERHRVATGRIAALEAEASILRRDLQTRRDSIDALLIDAAAVDERLAGYQRRITALLEELNRPPAPFNGSDTDLALALERAYLRGHR